MTSSAFCTTTNNRSRGTWVILAGTLALSCSLAATCQSEASLEELQRATAKSSLLDLSRPWHAKLAITIFDEKGKNPTEGSIELWRDGSEKLSVTTLGGSTLTSLERSQERYEASSGPTMTNLAETLIETFLHPGPDDDELKGAPATSRMETFGKAKLKCTMLGPAIMHMQPTPLGLYPTYCTDPATNALRLNFTVGGLGITLERVGNFLDHSVPVEFSMADTGVLMAKAKVESMTTFKPTAETFAVTTNLSPVSLSKTVIASGIQSGMKLGGSPPTYPASARSNHVQGTVTLRAVVGRDGRIHKLRVISTPDADLAASALLAVRTWRYKPYLLNGIPTEVDTTVVVNFNLN